MKKIRTNIQKVSFFPITSSAFYSSEWMPISRFQHLPWSCALQTKVSNAVSKLVSLKAFFSVFTVLWKVWNITSISNNELINELIQMRIKLISQYLLQWRWLLKYISWAKIFYRYKLVILKELSFSFLIHRYLFYYY